MQLSELSIKSLVPYINGDTELTTYRSGPDLVELFNSCFNETEDYWLISKTEGFGSRFEYTQNKLRQHNGHSTLQSLVAQLVDSRICSDSDTVAHQINIILKHDNFQLTQNILGIYKVTGQGLNSDLNIDTHFSNIEQEILSTIQSARFSIWVCVAWITNKNLANALFKKHQQGLNIRVIVNNDHLTRTHGCDFSKSNVNIEYYKVNPDSSHSNLMHHKFCIVDFHTVITGSFNWTNRANYNKEDISIIKSHKKAEGFALQFIALVNAEKTKALDKHKD